MPSKFSARLSKHARYISWANRGLVWAKAPRPNSSLPRAIPVQAEVTSGQGGRPHLVRRAFDLVTNLASSAHVRAAGLAGSALFALWLARRWRLSALKRLDLVLTPVSGSTPAPVLGEADIDFLLGVGSRHPSWLRFGKITAEALSAESRACSLAEGSALRPGRRPDPLWARAGLSVCKGWDGKMYVPKESALKEFWRSHVVLWERLSAEGQTLSIGEDGLGALKASGQGFAAPKTKHLWHPLAGKMASANHSLGTNSAKFSPLLPKRDKGYSAFLQKAWVL